MAFHILLCAFVMRARVDDVWMHLDFSEAQRLLTGSGRDPLCESLRIHGLERFLPAGSRRRESICAQRRRWPLVGRFSHISASFSNFASVRACASSIRTMSFMPV